MPQSITYSNEEITIEADLSQTNLKEVLIEGIPVLNKHYEYSQNKIVLKNER